MICMKKLRFSAHLRAKVSGQGPPDSARAQPCNIHFVYILIFNQSYILCGTLFFEKNLKLNAIHSNLFLKKYSYSGFCKKLAVVYLLMNYLKPNCPKFY